MEKAELVIALMPVSKYQIRIVIKPTHTHPTHTHKTFVWLEKYDNIKDAESRAKALSIQYEIPYEGIWEDNPFTRKYKCHFCGRNRPYVGNTYTTTKDMKIICEYCVKESLECIHKLKDYVNSHESDIAYKMNDFEELRDIFILLNGREPKKE